MSARIPINIHAEKGMIVPTLSDLTNVYAMDLKRMMINAYIKVVSVLLFLRCTVAKSNHLILKRI